VACAAARGKFPLATGPGLAKQAWLRPPLFRPPAHTARGRVNVARGSMDNVLLVFGGDIHKMPSYGEFFAQVTCAGGTAPFPDPAKALAEVARSMRPTAASRFDC